MSDELEKMTQAFRHNDPSPRPEAKKAALAAAMDVFDEEFAAEKTEARQGSAPEDRPMKGSSGWAAALFRRFSMKFNLRSLNPLGNPAAGFAMVAIVAAVSFYVVDMPSEDTPTQIEPKIVATNDTPPEEPTQIVAEQPKDVEVAALPAEPVDPAISETAVPDPIIVAALETIETSAPVVQDKDPEPLTLAQADPNLAGSNTLQKLDDFAPGNKPSAGELGPVSAETTNSEPASVEHFSSTDTKPAQKGDTIVVTATRRVQDQQQIPLAITSVPPIDAITVQARKRTSSDYSDTPRDPHCAYGRKARRERRESAAATPPAPSNTVSPQVLAIIEQIQPQFEADSVTQEYKDEGRDQFEEIEPNPLKVTSADPVSTFSIDVDTASYSFMRASLNSGVLPQKDAVRIEELINYFPYDYAGPNDKDTPFKAAISVVPTPWNKGTKLMHVGIKGYALDADAKPHSNLVFLIDTSGSMNASNKLPLLVSSFKLLLNSLSPDDTVSIVVYAGSAGTVLEPTKVGNKAKIIASLDRLRSGGSTAGAAGIRQAYALAQQNYVEGGVNRVILATDGDFNVGITNQEELKSYIERKRDTGVSLSVLGFGMGNYNDALMQTLAQNGNGNAAYIDNLSEARKVLVEQAGATLFTIAKDVKIQVEFNPAMVSEYRLIGYETRLLNREDFNNDKVDAGEIGAGHTVTAIYEITPVGSDAERNDPLRYQGKDTKGDTDTGGEYAFLKIRYKLPDGDTSTLITTPVTHEQEVTEMSDAPTDTRFAASVAAFGQLLRGGRYTGDYTYRDVINLAKGAKGEDEFGYRAEFINLVRLAKSAEAN
jgi:Ca-activated chloride channel homolog